LIKIFPLLNFFRPNRVLTYPPHQDEELLIEEYFFNYIKNTKRKKKFKKNIYYIPIFWTNYFNKQNYGKNIRLLKILILFFNLFTYRLKKFTVVQFGGGVKLPIDNTLIFASAGSSFLSKTTGYFSSDIGLNSTYIPIPLVSKKHNFDPVYNKIFKASFIGRPTHSIRDELVEKLSGIKEYKVELNEDYENIEKFEFLLENSIFSLCPRGTSPASFRLYEALEAGSIPIYISDEFWLPFKNKIDWSEICIFIKPSEIDKIPNRIDSIINNSDHFLMAKKGQETYQQFFNLDAICDEIISQLEYEMENDTLINKKEKKFTFLEQLNRVRN